MFKSKFEYRKYIVLLLIFISVSYQTRAAKRYWISTVTANWNSTTNWSSTSGGGSGSSVPGSNDTCYFDSNGLGRCDINANVSVKRFEIKSTYTDTVTQNAYTITAGSGGMVLANGVFIGSSSTITLSGTFTNSGCNFTSTSGTFEIKEGHFSLTGTGAFLHNNGLVKLFHGAITSNDTSKITLSTSSSNKEFYDMQFDVAVNYARYIKFPSSSIRVNHTLTSSGSGDKYICTGTLELMGDYTVSGGNTQGGGAYGVGTLKFMGTGAQTLTGSGSVTTNKIVHLDINKSSDTLYLSGTIVTGFDLKLTSGSLNAGTSQVYYRSSGSGIKVTGNFTRRNSLNKLYFTGSDNGSLTIHDTLQVNDSLVFSKSTGLAKGTNAGVLNAKGSITINVASPPSGTVTTLINGTGTQKIRSSLVYSNTTYLGCPNLKIQKSSTDTLFLIGFLPVQSAYNYISGIVISNAARIKFSGYNAPTISGMPTLKNVEFNQNSSGTAIVIASGSELTIVDSLILNGTSSPGANNFTGIINLKGSLYSTNTSTSAVGTGIIKINGTGSQTVYGQGTMGKGLLPNLLIDKPTGTLYLSSVISAGGDWTYTAAGSLDAGSSTVIFYGSKTISGNHALNNVSFAGSGTHNHTIASGTTLTVNGTLKLTGTGAIALKVGTIEAKGDIISDFSTVATAGSATILINGTGNQTLTGSGIASYGFLPNININKSSGTLNLVSIISVLGNWTYTPGATDSVNASGSTLAFYGTYTVTGSHALNNVVFPGSGPYTHTITSGTTLICNGTLSWLGSNRTIINTGTIEAKGDIVAANTYTSSPLTGGSATISITGSNKQKFTGTGASGKGYLPKISINKSADTLLLDSIINLNYDWVYIAGNVDACKYKNKVYFYGNGNIDAQGTSSTMSFYDAAIAAGTRTLTGDLKVSNNLTINSSTTLAQGSYGLSFGGYTNNGTHSITSGAITLIGGGYNTFTKSGGASFANVTLNRTGGSLSLSSPLTITGSLTMTKGKIKTTSTNLLTFNDNATTSGGSDSAYVTGPIKKTGNDAFTFPLGDTTIISHAYHPMIITAPTYTTDVFTGEYKYALQSYGEKTVDTLESVSNEDCFLLSRTVGSSNVKASLTWQGTTNFYINDLDSVSIAYLNPSDSVWRDLGGGSRVVNGNLTTVTSALNVPFSGTTASTMALGKKTTALIFAPMQRKLDAACYYTVKGNLGFRFDEEYADKDRKLSFAIRYTNTNKIVISDSNIQLAAMLGDNRYTINLNPYNSLLTLNKFYILEVTNEKNEKRYLRFKYITGPTVE